MDGGQSVVFSYVLFYHNVSDKESSRLFHYAFIVKIRLNRRLIMTDKKLNDDLVEHEESTANHEDLLIEGDEFQMNLVEKSDVGELAKPVDPKYQKEGDFGVKKTVETPTETIKETKDSTATHEDLLIEGDEFQMNLVEKSDTEAEDQVVHPDYQSELKRPKQ